MTTSQSDSANPSAQPILRKPLRVWPGVAAAVLILLVRYGLLMVKPEAMGTAMLGGLAGVLLVLIWWLFFSRAAWLDRLGAIVVAVAALFVASRLLDPSIRGGMMGFMFPIFSIPVLAAAFVAAVAATRRLSTGARRAATAAAILMAAGAWTMVRTGGITGEADSDFHWRWTPTPEEMMLARADAPRGAESAAGMAGEGSAWSGFRGPWRDGIVRGAARVGTDWTASPPVEIWRRPIGPGWSSFAVSGDFAYTQEQRGEEEAVSCYSMTTGEPVWRHGDPVRFYESNAGAGPRATPTLAGGRVYTLGATGILNVLDARDGAVVWSRDAAKDSGAKLPGWGFAGSPLVIDDLVIAATSGTLVAYDRSSGQPRWVGPKGGQGYGSPHLLEVDGVAQILLASMSGTVSVAPADGTVLWKHEWKNDGIVQPAVTVDGDVLLGSGSGLQEVGMRRLGVRRGGGGAVAEGAAGDAAGARTEAVAEGTSEAVAAGSSGAVAEHGSGAGAGASGGTKGVAAGGTGAESGAGAGGGWTVEERWTSNGLKPYFSDFVVHEGHAYGFDGAILSCIGLEDGERRWKGGRYGHGQLVLLPEQDLLLVLSEQGDLALVRAMPDSYAEVARHPAIKGKTWNHPVLAGDVLLVRNAEEMAAFRLPAAGGSLAGR